jgi:hypothetical protein
VLYVAPVVHPASSCSQRRVQVLGHPLLVGGLGIILSSSHRCPSPPPPCHCCCCLCHPPPCCLSSPVAILLPVIPIPIAPRSHPVSSCSRQQLGVLLWWLLWWHHVTAPASGKTRNCELLRAQELKHQGWDRDPPREQMLMVAALVPKKFVSKMKMK